MSGPLRNRFAPVRSWTRAAAAVLALGLAGCVSSPDEVDAELERNRDRWRAQRLADYVVQYQLGCFCAVDVAEPVLLTVRGGGLVAVARVSDGHPVDPSGWEGRYYTVEELFALIADSQREGAAEVRVRYDAELGYPADVYLDPVAGIADDERSFELRGLARLP